MKRLFSNKKINNSRQDIKGQYCYTCDSYCQSSCTNVCSYSCSRSCSDHCVATCNGMAGYM